MPLVTWVFVSLSGNRTNVNFTELVLSFLSLGGFCFVSRLLLTDRSGVCKHTLKGASRQQHPSAAQAALMSLCSRDHGGGW